MRYQVIREGGFFVIRLTPLEFADFAFEQMEGNKAEEPKDNGEAVKARRGRPPKESQPTLAEENSNV